MVRLLTLASQSNCGSIMSKSSTKSELRDTLPHPPMLSGPMNRSRAIGSVETTLMTELFGIPSCCKSITYLDFADTSIICDSNILPSE